MAGQPLQLPGLCHSEIRDSVLTTEVWVKTSDPDVIAPPLLEAYAKFQSVVIEMGVVLRLKKPVQPVTDAQSACAFDQATLNDKVSVFV